MSHSLFHRLVEQPLLAIWGSDSCQGHFNIWTGEAGLAVPPEPQLQTSPYLMNIIRTNSDVRVRCSTFSTHELATMGEMGDPMTVLLVCL